MENLQNSSIENEQEVVKETVKTEEVGDGYSTGPDSDEEVINKNGNKDEKDKAQVIVGDEIDKYNARWNERLKEERYNYESRNGFSKICLWLVNHFLACIPEWISPNVFAHDGSGHDVPGCTEKKYWIAGGRIETGKAGKFFYSLAGVLTFGLIHLITIGCLSFAAWWRSENREAKRDTKNDTVTRAQDEYKALQSNIAMFAGDEHNKDDKDEIIRNTIYDNSSRQSIGGYLISNRPSSSSNSNNFSNDDRSDSQTVFEIE